MTTKMSLEQLVAKIRQTKHSFHCKFVKRDQSIREMNCVLAEFAPEWAFKGGKRAYNPDEKDLICVWEKLGQNKGQFRSIAMEGVLEVIYRKKRYVFKQS